MARRRYGRTHWAYFLLCKSPAIRDLAQGHWSSLYGWITLKVQSQACLYPACVRLMPGWEWIWADRNRCIVRKRLVRSQRTQSSMMHIPRIRHICFELSMTSFNPSHRLSSLPGAFIKAERRKQIDGIRTGRKGASNRVKCSHRSHAETLKIITNECTKQAETLSLGIKRHILRWTVQQFLA